MSQLQRAVVERSLADAAAAIEFYAELLREALNHSAAA
jgi:hypothetical protein